MKLTKHFWLEEFVTDFAFTKFGNNAILLIDKRIVDIAEWLRGYFDKPITINNWHSGGAYHFSGWRSCQNEIGAEFSQHKFGRAIDIKVRDVTPKEMQDFIVYNFNTLRLYGLTTMEKGTPTWTHIDVRWTGLNKLKIIQV